MQGAARCCGHHPDELQQLSARVKGASSSLEHLEFSARDVGRLLEGGAAPDETRVFTEGDIRALKAKTLAGVS